MGSRIHACRRARAPARGNYGTNATGKQSVRDMSIKHRVKVINIGENGAKVRQMLLTGGASIRIYLSK